MLESTINFGLSLQVQEKGEEVIRHALMYSCWSLSQNFVVVVKYFLALEMLICSLFDQDQRPDKRHQC